MPKRNIPLIISIFIYFLLFFGTFTVILCENENEPVMVNALGKVISVLETGEIDFENSYAKDSLKQAGLAVFKVVPPIIKGLVPENDPAVFQISRMEQTFKIIVGSFSSTVMAPFEGSKESEEWTNIFYRFKSRANTSVTNIAGIFRYNVTDVLLQGYISTCLGSDGPVAIKNDFYFQILQKCKNSFNVEEINRCVSMIKFLEPFQIDAGSKMKLALQSTVSQIVHNENIDWMLQVQDKSLDRINKMVAKLVKEHENALCPYHYVFYGTGCSRNSLMQAFGETLNSFLQISASGLACGMIINKDEKAFTNYLETFYSSISTMIQMLPNYLQNAMTTSPLLCDHIIVSNAVAEFPGPQIIKNYPAFGEYLSNRFRQLNPNIKHNIVIIGYFGKDSKYWCLSSNCDIYWHESRGLMIFYESHEHVDNEIETTKSFLEKNLNKINETITNNFWKNLDQIKAIMDSSQISLSGKGRFTKELWIRHRQFTSPCTFNFYSTNDTNNGTFINFHLSFKNVYSLKIDYCNSFEIFVFP